MKKFVLIGLMFSFAYADLRYVPSTDHFYCVNPKYKINQDEYHHLAIHCAYTFGGITYDHKRIITYLNMVGTNTARQMILDIKKLLKTQSQIL